ncbi:SusC/RagA family TonB-linked outer membrane protein [Pontibacter qinzhouensis]|uniref:SusC/RagA family TonB-linked outer membrane protein n=1 Tax=Pontibacter qinzhouensis TaxID=2603253 RepID=A0A5C8JIC3_9BACT|nr:SusC/RagA family TonB-linked outer membrane protein [Pontibacter qinzhouensis]TXK36454.1 SusC/RagA family TonB-linked outer membrane protein [Pontibacter qinzhouensis]
MNRILLLLSFLCLPSLAWAQQPVRGRVVDAADKRPLPGASVAVKNTKTGTLTDAEGYFELPVLSPNPVLLVSFLGYTPQEISLQLPLTAPLVISLRQNETRLREVEVSTGYQQLPPERATGSFARVSEERLNEQVSTGVLSRLEAVANGLTVDRGTDARGRLTVRGLSTIQGPRDPLIVVDNFPYEGDLNNLNPNDVESVTVLKDAAAASIWGARAGNGVIVITTKKGRFNQPLRVAFNTNTTITGKPDLSHIPQMTSADFIDMERMLYERGFYNSQISSTNRTALTPVVELLVQRADGTRSEQEVEAELQALRGLDVRDDFDRYLYGTGVNQQYSLSLSGGSASNSWLLSSGYDRNRDHLDAGYSRLNLRFQNTLRLLKRLEITTGMYYTQSHSSSGKPGYGEVTMLNGNLYPYARFADGAGNPLPVVKDYRQPWREAVGNGRLLDWDYYPLEDYRHSRGSSDLQDVLANAGLHYTLPGGLSADLRYQYERQQTDSEQLADAQSFAARSLVNLYTRLDPATGNPVYAVPVGGILDLGHSTLEAHSARGQLNLDRAFGQHAVTAIAGAELRSTAATGSGTRYYGYDAGNLTFGQVDHNTPHQLLTNGRTALIVPGNTLQSTLSRFVSLYGNAAYTFRERYTLSASARRDASNLFGVLANDRWKPLWSTGLAWNLSEEKFYRVDLLPLLRLRTSYGFSGNVDQRRTAVTTLSYRPNVSPFTGSPMAIFSNYANPELRWETSRMFNLGLDFSFRGERVTGSLAYYRKKGTDLFGRELVDYTSGIGNSITKNVAGMAGSGVDLELDTRNIETPRFTWRTHLNLSHSRDKILEYYLSDLRGSSFVSSSPLVSGIVGKPVFSVLSYRWAGLDPATGDPQGYLDGAPGKDYAALLGTDVQLEDLRFHGSAIPTFFGSLGNTVTLGHLSLTARLTYKLGYYFRRSSVNYNLLYRNGTMHADFADRWQQPGDEALTDVPSMNYPAVANRDTFYAGAEVLVERADHVRLQYVTASYDFTKDTFRGLPFQSLQAYLNASNLGLLWAANKRGLDPDVQLNRFPLPVARSYAIGLRASF